MRSTLALAAFALVGCLRAQTGGYHQLDINPSSGSPGILVFNDTSTLTTAFTLKETATNTLSLLNSSSAVISDFTLDGGGLGWQFYGPAAFIQPTTDAGIPLTIFGKDSRQSADLLQIYGYSGGPLHTRVQANGTTYLGYSNPIPVYVNGSLAANAGTSSTVPFTVNAVCCVGAQTADLIELINNGATVAKFDNLGGLTAGTSALQSVANADTPLTILGHSSSQSGDLLQIYGYAGGPLDVRVEANGTTYVGYSTAVPMYVNGSLAANAGTSSTVPFTVNAVCCVGAQTADLLEIINSGTTVAKFDQLGNLTVPSCTGCGGGGGSPGGSNFDVQFNNSGAFGGSNDLIWNGSVLGLGHGAHIQFDPSGTTALNMEIGAPTVNELDFVDSSSVIEMYLKLNAGGSGWQLFAPTVFAEPTTDVGIAMNILGHSSSQTADLLQVSSYSGGSLLLQITAAGTTTFGYGNPVPVYVNGSLAANAGTSSTVPFTVNAVCCTGAQAADLIELINSGTTVAKFDHLGNLNLATNVSTVITNRNSPALYFNGTYWTGSASAPDAWEISQIMGTGANPTTTLQIDHPTGTSGAANIALNAPVDAPAFLGSDTPSFSSTCGATLSGNSMAGILGNLGSCNRVGQTATITFSYTAPNGWVCSTLNLTAFGIPAIFLSYTSTTNSVTFYSGTASSTSESYQCNPY